MKEKFRSLVVGGIYRGGIGVLPPPILITPKRPPAPVFSSTSAGLIDARTVSSPQHFEVRTYVLHELTDLAAYYLEKRP